MTEQHESELQLTARFGMEMKNELERVQQTLRWACTKLEVVIFLIDGLDELHGDVELHLRKLVEQEVLSVELNIRETVAEVDRKVQESLVAYGEQRRVLLAEEGAAAFGGGDWEEAR